MAKRKKYVWILSGQSESGDPYTWAFSKMPTDDDRERALSENEIGEDGWTPDHGGPGAFGSRVSLDPVERVEVADN